MQPDLVVLVTVPPLVAVTVSVLPTLHPLATRAANNAAESIKARLPSKLEFSLFNKAMLLIPKEHIENPSTLFLFFYNNHLT
jgi:hypothetical protein